METSTLLLRFQGASVGEANQLANSLEHHLNQQSPDVKVERRRENPETMDFGSTLVLVLGAPAVVAAVGAIKAWIARNNAASVELELPDRKIVLRNIESEHVAAIIEAIRQP